MIAVALNIHVAIAARRFGTRSCGSNFQLQAKRNIVACCRAKQTLTFKAAGEFKGRLTRLMEFVEKDRYRCDAIYYAAPKKRKNNSFLDASILPSLSRPTNYIRIILFRIYIYMYTWKRGERRTIVNFVAAEQTAVFARMSRNEDFSLINIGLTRAVKKIR